MRWTAYPLHTDIPEEGISLGGSAAKSKHIDEMNERLKNAADEAGLPFGRRTKSYSTRLAHELGKWVQSQGKGDAFHNAVFRAVFVENINIALAPVLVDLVEGLGLSGRDAMGIVESHPFRDAVDADWFRSLEIDPEYIPSLMIGDQLLVNPQKYALFEQFMLDNDVQKRNP